MTLRTRLTLLVALAVAASIATASVVVYLLVRDQLRDQVDETLRERSAAARVALGTELPNPPPGSGFVVPTPRAAGFSVVGQLIDIEGTVLAISNGGVSIPVGTEARQVAAGALAEHFSDIEVGESKFRVLTTPGPGATALQVARPLDEVNQTLSDLAVLLLLLTGGGVAVAAVLGLGVARAALAPAAAVSSAAEHVARTHDLSRRIDVRGSDELARMAASFNEMMAALERSTSAQRALVADASHELRTPLATLRTNIETLQRGDDLPPDERRRIVSELAAEVEQLSGLVADVVELGREGTEPGVELTDIRLDELAEAAVDRTRRRAPSVTIVEALEPTTVRGDPARLDRAIQNLLDNAIKWAPEDGRVKVSVADRRVTVADNGRGIPPQDLPRIFDRFYRSAAARGKPGSGLGLSIVRRIAEEHGGTVRASNGGDGGAVLEIRLPGNGGPQGA